MHAAFGRMATDLAGKGDAGVAPLAAAAHHVERCRRQTHRTGFGGPLFPAGWVCIRGEAAHARRVFLASKSHVHGRESCDMPQTILRWPAEDDLIDQVVARSVGILRQFKPLAGVAVSREWRRVRVHSLE